MAENANLPERDWGLYGLIVAGIAVLALLIQAECRAIRANQESEAEQTRRYVAEEVAKANERAAVNAIRIEHLDDNIEPPADSPPAN